MRRRTAKRTGKPKNVQCVKRIRNKRKPNYRLLFSIFMISAAISCTVSFALQTPVFSVKQVKVEGVKLADYRSVQKVANAAVEKNIFLLEKSSIISKISEFSEVEYAEMGRSFPNKAWVRVKERQASAIITNGSKYCLIQDNGLAFHFTKGRVAGVPLLDVAECGSIKEGCICDADNVKYALEVARYARKNGIRVNKISVDPLGYICLNIESGFYVKMGSADEIALKMSKLRYTLACKPSIVKEAAYLDISALPAISWKPKKAVGTES